MSSPPTWDAFWQELCNQLTMQPACPQHPAYPHVRTIRQGVINDLIDISERGILVRSHRTVREDLIEPRRFEIWWNHLVTYGSASLHPGDPHNPHPWRSSVTGVSVVSASAGAICLARCSIRRTWSSGES
jgi:hypothetical protein